MHPTLILQHIADFKRGFGMKVGQYAHLHVPNEITMPRIAKVLGIQSLSLFQERFPGTDAKSTSQLRL